MAPRPDSALRDPAPESIPLRASRQASVGAAMRSRKSAVSTEILRKRMGQVASSRTSHWDRQWDSAPRASCGQPPTTSPKYDTGSPESAPSRSEEHTSELQ